MGECIERSEEVSWFVSEMFLVVFVVVVIEVVTAIAVVAVAVVGQVVCRPGEAYS